MKRPPQTRRELSNLLEISQSTLRTWDRIFRQRLQAPVGRKGNATRKRYTTQDVLLFQIVAQRRREGASFDEIKGTLDADLQHPEPFLASIAPATQQVIYSPIIQSAPAAPAISTAELDTFRTQVAELKAELRMVQRERDRLWTAMEQEKEARVSAEREAAALTAQLEMIGTTLPTTDQNEKTTTKQPPQTGIDRSAAHRPPSWWKGFTR